MFFISILGSRSHFCFCYHHPQNPATLARPENAGVEGEDEEAEDEFEALLEEAETAEEVDYKKLLREAILKTTILRKVKYLGSVYVRKLRCSFIFLVVFEFYHQACEGTKAAIERELAGLERRVGSSLARSHRTTAARPSKKVRDRLMALDST